MVPILLFSAALLVIIPLMNLLLPNFQHQKHVTSIASFLGKSENELRRMNHNSMTRFFSERFLPKIDDKWKIDNIFGKKTRERFRALGRNESYLEYLGMCSFRAIVVSLLVVVLFFLLDMPTLILLSPVVLIGLMIAQLQDLKNQFKKRQNLLIRDLTNLIGKIVTSLESGKPLPVIFEQVANQTRVSNPLLSTMLKRLIANSQKMPMREALQIFANEVQIPVMYDFISIVHIAMEKGYSEAVPDFLAIKSDIRNLRRLSLVERTKGNPEKMNLFYGLIFLIVFIFLILTGVKVFDAMNTL